MVDDNVTPALADLLAERSIHLDETAIDKFDAIRKVGAALLSTRAVEPSYVDAMIEREETVSTYVGEGVAIPHGTLLDRGVVRSDAIVLLRFPNGIDWDGNDVVVCIGIAARGNGHIALLSQLATILMRPEKAALLRTATTTGDIYSLLAPDDGD